MEQQKDSFAVEKQGQQDLGTIRIADDVVAMIASIAAMEVEGVASMAGEVATDLMNRVSFKKASKGVKVEIKDNVVRVNLAVVLQYGYNIPATSGKIQTRIKQAIENMTGLSVADVNIRIAGIRMPETEE